MDNVMHGVDENNEGMDVDIINGNIIAYNESGYNQTSVPIIDVLEWAYNNMNDEYMGFVVSK